MLNFNYTTNLLIATLINTTDRSYFDIMYRCK